MWILSILLVQKVPVYLTVDGQLYLMKHGIPTVRRLLRKCQPRRVQPTHSYTNMAISTNQAQHPNSEDLFSKYFKNWNT